MDDALLVRRFERLGDLLRDRECLVQLDRASHNALGQILTLDPFHDKGVNAWRFLDRINRGDVWMIQRRERLRFAFKSRETFRVGGEYVRQNLDRDLPAQCGIGGSVDVPHAAFADRRADFVCAEARAGCEGQRGVGIRACARAAL
jgi:hypothetical protein